jgi:hypothetical protein
MSHHQAISYQFLFLSSARKSSNTQIHGDNKNLAFNNLLN